MTPASNHQSTHITQVIRKALEIANFDNLPTYFVFNGVRVRVMPGESQEDVENRWYLGFMVSRTPQNDFNDFGASTPVMPVWLL